MSKCIHMNEAILCYQCKYIELIKENERLKDIAIGEVHTCSKHCKRPMCVMRMNSEKLTKALAVAESALRVIYTNTESSTFYRYDVLTNSHEYIQEALEQIEKIKKG